jgi:putative transposase
MPNHAHILVLPLVPLSVFMKWLKGIMARQANELLNRTGQPFWQDESFDHYVRSEHQFNQITNYIEMNPVQAGLLQRPDLWHWSSANSNGQAECLPHLKLQPSGGGAGS